jgi:general secretion pathway protein C
MGQYLSWLANGVLFVLCCYMVADTTNEVFAALLTPEPAEFTAASAGTAATGRSWSDREIILERNLFNASMLAPPRGPEPEIEPEEDLAATQLPLRLLGTAAAIPAEYSWAAVIDESERRTLIVGIEDKVNKATVKRIERRRLVLSEGGKLRELVLDEDAAPAGPGRAMAKTRGKAARGRNKPRRAPPNKAKAAEKIQKLAEDRFKVNRGDVDEVMENPANLFSQARILPKYQDGAMVGLQINAIKPGSLFEEIGIQSGDVITKLNGIVIDNPQESAKVLTEFSEAESFTVEVEREDGSSDTLQFSIDE